MAYSARPVKEDVCQIGASGTRVERAGSVGVRVRANDGFAAAELGVNDFVVQQVGSSFFVVRYDPMKK